MNKAEIRTLMRQKKRTMLPEDIAYLSEVLCRRFLATPQYREAKVLYGYLSFNQEVRTEAILRHALLDGKQVAVPKIRDGEMHFFYLDDLSRVQQGFYGIPEPTDDAREAHNPHALVLLPGLAFDSHGNRVGYGGGYYDRFLAREPGHPTVALCYGFQLLNHIDTDINDVPADLVIQAE